MRHDTSSPSRQLETSRASNGTANKVADHVVDSIEGLSSTDSGSHSAAKQNGTKQANGDDKNDSEAETEIESGKEDGLKASKRKIKHEGKHDEPPNGQRKHHDTRDHGDRHKATDADALDKPSSTSGKDPEASTSSILTSVHSSPSNEQSSRGGSENAAHSPSKTSVDSDTTKNANAKRKRDHDDADVNEKRKVKREDSPASNIGRRSDSPPVRSRRRTASTSTSTPANQQSGQPRGRRKPPPIQTKGDNNDIDSDDSSVSRNHSYHRKSLSSSVQHANRKLNQGVNTAKYRDRNGRTLLAKACFSDTVDIVRERFHENPDHLDIKEYAENSPLQIAALGGEAEIVKFLVDQGANVNTQNVAKDTPLIDAVENAHLEVIRILLDAGANPSQPNAKGEEPLELIPDEDDDASAIRSILLEAKEKYKLRKPGEASGQPPTSGKSRGSAPIPSPKGSPSFHPGRSLADAGRSRRAQRGQSKRDDLLWIAATPARLQQAAGEGDAQATNHILSMGIPADSESVLAAAKGCHEDCLQLLMAFGSPEVADPDPIPGLKPGWDTPLLAAIGQSGENLSIIEILLGQKGFNPTRKPYQNKTYYEIAKERAGPNSAEEQSILRKAYDDFSRENGSPKKKKKKSNGAEVSSPRATKQAVDASPRKDDVKPRPSSDAKLLRRRGSIDRPPSSSSKLHASLKLKSRESSVAMSDREREPSPSRRVDKRRRISSSSEDNDKVVTKQRKRLLTGKEKREGSERDRKRRSSITSLDTPRTKLQDEMKKARASASPARDRDRDRATVERKASDPASLQKLKRQRSDVQPPNEKSALSKKSTIEPTSKQAEASSDGKMEADSDKRRKRDEEEAAKEKVRKEKEQEQRRKDKEAAERESKAEADRQAALKEKEEQERKRKQEEEERIRKEEEEAARRKKEEEEKEEERKRKEAEEARQREVQRQKDQIRLPDGLFSAFYFHKDPPDTRDLENWRHLRTVKTKNLLVNGLDVGSDDDNTSAEWVLNLQVAVLLGLKDLSLSSNKRLAACDHVALPPHLSLRCASWWTNAITQQQASDEIDSDYYKRVNQNRGKFAALADTEELFFVRKHIFDETTAEAPHLQNLRLEPCPFAFYRPPQERLSEAP